MGMGLESSFLVSTTGNFAAAGHTSPYTWKKKQPRSFYMIWSHLTSLPLALYTPAIVAFSHVLE